MKETIQDLLGRRSCRAYETRQVTPEDLEVILKAWTYAPTAVGRQSPYIVAVQDPAAVAAIERLNAAVLGNPEGHPFYGAPTVVVVFGDPSLPFGIADGNLVIGNLLNAAHAVGVDSCYIWRAKESFESEEGRALKAAWGIPEGYQGIGNVILGYGKPQGIRPAAPRKEGYVKLIR